MSTVSNKKISIIIPIFNQADKIENCLKSIYNQSYNNYEVIMINDGSTDGVELKIENLPFRFKSFKFFSQKNQGANVARNCGFKEASGDYLLFCDADITMESGMLESMITVLEMNSQISYVYSSFYWGNKLFRLFEFDSDKLKKMPFIHTTSLIRKEKFPGFNIQLKRLQDWDLWLTMLEQGSVGAWIDKPLFRVETGGTMSNWLPSFAYKLFPFLPSVKKYNRAVETIKEKHCLNK
ncbi:glycosyltransferase family 2 protein [Patescibacteria group bacterium]|nr:glycosyltransferase family 2 protein [Patescibacteria group bacterium]